MLSRGSNGVGIPRSRRARPASEKISAPNANGDGDGDDNRDQCRAGMRTRTVVNFHPIPVPAFPLWEISPSPYLLPYPWLGKISILIFFRL